MQTDNTIVPDGGAASFILVELRGGPFHGQTMSVPADEFHLTLNHEGKQYFYSRFNNAPVFHHESAIVRLLGGGR